jgi:hypothetical protein
MISWVLVLVLVLIGAFKVFEDHQRKEGEFTRSLSAYFTSIVHTDHFITGKPISHQFAKELLVGFAGAEVDKLAETKGADWVDREKAKRAAKENVENMYDQHYVQGQGADQYDP